MVFSCSSKLVECTIWRAITSLQWLSNTIGIVEEEKFWSAVSKIFAIHPNLGGGGLKGIFGELWSDGRWNLTAVVVTSCSQRPGTKRHCQAFIHTWQRRYRVIKIDCYVWVQACDVWGPATQSLACQKKSKQSEKRKRSSVLESKCRVFSSECLL